MVSTQPQKYDDINDIYMIPPMTKNPAKKINHQELPVNFKDVLKHHEYLYDYPLVIFT
jgi:hypothetical protein